MTHFTSDQASKMVRDFELFLLELHEFRQVHCLQGPAANSLAVSERTSFADAERVMTAYSQGLVLLEVADDQAECFIRAVADPALTFAVWTSVRAVLEASALASWLLDTSLTPRLRVQRSLAFRYEGLEQQLKTLKSIDRLDDRDKLLERVDNIELSVSKLGFNKVADRKGKRIGIGQVMPNATDIIRDVLDEEATYRILSAVARGHLWALHQLGMETLTEQESGSWDSIHASTSAVQKHLRPEGVGYLCVKTATVFTKALWRAACIFGWNVEQLESILEKNFDRLQFKEEVRHWRK